MDFRAPSCGEESDDAIRDAPYRPFYSMFGGQPILVKQYMPNSGRVHHDTDCDGAVFKGRPFLGVLLFDNVSSDARDHAANERSRSRTAQRECVTDGTVAFLSWLKLSVYMAIVSVAIVMSFHLKSQPSVLGMCPASLGKDSANVQ
jgi:hypothetical protein